VASGAVTGRKAAASGVTARRAVAS
jgi:hypothetical protein